MKTRQHEDHFSLGGGVGRGNTRQFYGEQLTLITVSFHLKGGVT